MDNNTLTTAGLASTFTIAAAILYKIYLVVNHKRIRSNCCGTKLEASIDIEETTPPSGGFNKRSSPELNSQQQQQQPQQSQQPQQQQQIFVKRIEIPKLDLQANKNNSNKNMIDNPILQVKPNIIVR